MIKFWQFLIVYKLHQIIFCFGWFSSDDSLSRLFFLLVTKIRRLGFTVSICWGSFDEWWLLNAWLRWTILLTDLCIIFINSKFNIFVILLHIFGEIRTKKFTFLWFLFLFLVTTIRCFYLLNTIPISTIIKVIVGLVIWATLFVLLLLFR